MRAYAADDEKRVRLQHDVRAWADSGLLDPAQAAALEAELRTPLKRTNRIVRGVLAFFTAVIVAASLALVFVTFGVDDEVAAAAITGLAAIACLVLADALVTRARLYRYGIEESLAVAGIALLGASTAITIWSAGHGDRYAFLGGLAAAGVAAVLVYLRYGFVYSAIGAMACFAAIPFQLHLPGPWPRIVAASGLGAAFVVVRACYRRAGDEYPGDEYAALQAAAWAAIYLLINLHLGGVIEEAGVAPWPELGRATYWGSYALTWAMPIVGLALAVRGRERQLLDVSVAMAIASLSTHKPYWGLPRHSWDPLLLGLLLMGVAIGLRRWLAAGANGGRRGFVADRVLAADRDLLRVVANASAAVHPAPQPSAFDRGSGGFGGGRSGGGGASGSY
jgi:hypothetical protein